MELRGLRPITVDTFAGYARCFLAHVGKTPATVTAADVGSFVLDHSATTVLRVLVMRLRPQCAAFFLPLPALTLPLVFRAPKLGPRLVRLDSAAKKRSPQPSIRALGRGPIASGT
jgi:hypothetical protein